MDTLTLVSVVAHVVWPGPGDLATGLPFAADGRVCVSGGRASQFDQIVSCLHLYIQHMYALLSFYPFYFIWTNVSSQAFFFGYQTGLFCLSVSFFSLHNKKKLEEIPNTGSCNLP